ncbi:MAG: NADH:flavin oxidoreductase/NADH oxidase family protein [Hyphomicrobiaceae bacterium]|nr:NADH:flavin oxidoreductase/NADH oxidase family protein [Hyphomicrobiaceae bacterium]
MVDISRLAEPLALPCGVTLENRIVKAALTEGLADGTNAANDRFVTLYRTWGQGGAAMLITGNVLVDRFHLERGGNLAVEGQQTNAALDKLAEMASAAKAHGARIVAQLNHAGRQTQKAINKKPSAPSDIALKMGNGRFGQPVPLNDVEIEETIEAFVSAARTLRSAGFDGVQIHAAHGYLMSQFLSPLSNRRRDEWGGSLENRARILIEIMRRVRAATSDGFIVAAKLNSADFQRGGFSEADSVVVAKWLEDAGCDFIEVSGGNYEQPRMIDFDRKDPLAAQKRESTRQREAYFLDFVPRLREAVTIPVMVTGGFRSVAAMLEAIELDGVDLIGLGRPMIIDPDIAAKILSGRVERAESRDEDLVVGSGLLGPRSPISYLRDLNAWGALGWYYEHIYSLADGRKPDLNLSPLRALLSYDRTETRTARAVIRPTKPH